MLTKAYTVYDLKSLSYSPPFFQPANGAAVRLFSDLANDPQTTIGRHPADYVLYCSGVFDDQTGMLLPFDAREHVVDAISLVKTQPPLFSTEAK